MHYSRQSFKNNFALFQNNTIQVITNQGVTVLAYTNQKVKSFFNAINDNRGPKKYQIR